MKRIFAIGHTEFRIFFKQKSAYIWLFVIPLMFTYFLGFAIRPPGDPSNRFPPVLVENNDTNFLGRIFVEELTAQQIWLLDPTNRANAERIIRIPTNFTAEVMQMKTAKVQFLKRDDSSEADTALIEARLVRALIAMNGQLLEAASPANGLASLTEAQMHDIMKEPDRVTLDARFAGRKPIPTGFSFSLPGNMVMYVMLNLLTFGGAMIAAERRNGVIRRLVTYPVTLQEVVMGKIYGLMLLGLAQILVFLAAGKFLFRINLGGNLPAVGLVLLILAWVAGSLGTLIASLTTAEDRVMGICILVSLLSGALGGCWWPLEIGPPSLRIIALCTPTGWALPALHQLISFGAGLDAVIVPLAVLIAVGAVANYLAARFFRP